MTKAPAAAVAAGVDEEKDIAETTSMATSKATATTVRRQSAAAKGGETLWPK